MKTVKIDLRVTPDLKAAIQLAAQKANLSVTAFLTAAAIERMYGLKPSQRAPEAE